MTSALVPGPPFLSILTPRLKFGQVLFVCLFCFVVVVIDVLFQGSPVSLFANGNNGQDMLSLLSQLEGRVLWFLVCPADFL